MRIYQMFKDNSKQESILVMAKNYEKAKEYSIKKGYGIGLPVGRVRTSRTKTRELIVK